MIKTKDVENLIIDLGQAENDLKQLTLAVQRVLPILAEAVEFLPNSNPKRQDYFRLLEILETE